MEFNVVFMWELCKVFLMFQHLAATNHWVCFWPDLPHKFQRKQAMVFSRCPQAKQLLKNLMRVFRSNRAPFSTSKFGKTLLESKHRMIAALKKNLDSEILEMYLPGIAKDLGCSPLEMTPWKALQHLIHKSLSSNVKSTECSDARWGAWLDHAQAWDKVWHQEVMTVLYSQWECGENPYKGTASQGDVPDDDRSYSIQKIRWQVRRVKSIGTIRFVVCCFNPSVGKWGKGLNWVVPMFFLIWFVPKVLSDDLNQDYMRSMISVFRQARMYVGRYVSRTNKP